MKMKKILFLVLFSFYLIEAIPPAHAGNFQNNRRPSAIFGFGQNIISKERTQGYINTTHVRNEKSSLSLLIWRTLYGITDSLSLCLQMPFIVQQKIDGKENSGIGDLEIQLEYAFWQKSTIDSYNQITFLGTIYVPTGEEIVNQPGASIGSTQFFIGSTFSRLTTYWYYYSSIGGLLSTTRKSDEVKFGNAALYEFGIGRNLGNPSGITLTGMLEFSGVLSSRNLNCSFPDNNTGGNSMFLGPSLYSSYNNFALYGGFLFPVSQQLNGIQEKNKLVFTLTISMAW